MPRSVPFIVGFGGSALSGKSHISERVSRALGWPRASFGDYVREVAREQGQSEHRTVLQTIGENLVRTDVDGFCRSVLKRASWTPGMSAVLDGIRHASVVTSLRSIVAPEPVLLILVTASRPQRLQRLVKRKGALHGNLETADISLLDMHSTEVEVNTLLPTFADLTVNSSDAGDDRVDEILRWLESHVTGRQD